MATQTEMVEMIKELAYAIAEIADAEASLETPTSATEEALRTAIQIVRKVGNPDGINETLKSNLKEIEHGLEFYR